MDLLFMTNYSATRPGSQCSLCSAICKTCLNNLPNCKKFYKKNKIIFY